ncbi:hypothetical protein [Paenibacillus senegalensis]|uniref:hypothetical protein n=1 Tax=Paenibacillus senegalensis TaxID=1465766 RepID=UPI0011DDCF2F|nr:hypothetical protein [Paenibacillus senegalensis]
MNKEAAERWGQRRQIGRSKFLINYCILAIGLPIAILLTALELLYAQEIRWPLLVSRFLLFPVLAILFGMGYWDSRERKYMDYLKTTEE